MAIKIAGTTVIDDSRNITTDVGTVDGRDLAADGTKLDSIAANATGDQTKADIDALEIDAGSVDGFTVAKSVPSNALFTDTNTTYSVGDGGLTQKNFTTADNTKLDGIETGATADQTKADIDALNVDADTLDGSHASAFATAAQGTLANAALPKAGGTVTGNLTVNPGALTVSGRVNTGEVNTGNGQHLVLNAGETRSYATGQTGEQVYLNAEAGIQINSSPDNWATGWAGRNTTTISNAAGDSSFGGNVGVSGNITVTGTVDGRDVATDGTKLDGIATSANNYSFPYTVSSNAGNSTVVQRNGNGYIFGNYFNGTGTFATTNAGGTMGMFTGTNGTDTYGRSYNAAAARTLLNVENGATADQTPAQLLAAIKTVDINGSNGLNAGRLDGHALTTASTGSTVVERDASGDIKARLFRSEYDTTNSSIGYFMTQVDTVNNNYMRPSTAAQVRSALNVEDGATAGGGFSATSATGTTPSLNVGNDTFFNHGKDTGNTTVSFTNVPTEASWKYSYQPAVVSGAWDIDTRTSKDSQGFTSWETTPTGMHIDSTGTKLFIVGTGADGVSRFDLTVPWDPRSAVFHSESASFVNLDASFQDIFISPSGEEMFLIGDGGNAVHRWNMDVDFDVTDLSGRVTFGTGAQDTTVRGLTFSPDGTNMYVAGGQYNRIYHYTLSNAFSFSPQPAYQGYKTVPEGDPSAVFFKPDGTKMFVGGYSTDTVYAYDLSTAWSVTTASADTDISIQNWQGNMSGLFFSPGGEYMYIIGNTGDRISRFSLGTLSTLTLPSSVDGVVTPVDPFARCTLEFVTLNGGTDVMLVNQSTIGLST